MPKQRPVAAEVVATSASPKGGAAPRPGPARGAARSPSTAPRCDASPRRAPPPLARRDDPLSRVRGQPWPAPATRRAGRSPRPPHGTAPPAIRHAAAAAPRRASGWRSTAAPAPGAPAPAAAPSARTPVALRAPSVRADPSACTTSLDRTISPPPWTLDSPLIRVQENRGRFTQRVGGWRRRLPWVSTLVSLWCC